MAEGWGRGSPALSVYLWPSEVCRVSRRTKPRRRWQPPQCGRTIAPARRGRGLGAWQSRIVCLLMAFEAYRVPRRTQPCRRCHLQGISLVDDCRWLLLVWISLLVATPVHMMAQGSERICNMLCFRRLERFCCYLLLAKTRRLSCEGLPVIDELMFV